METLPAYYSLQMCQLLSR
nr:unnamed protein product [Callosobruchus analis]